MPVSVAAIGTLLAIASLDSASAARCGSNKMYCSATGACLSTQLMCNGKADCPNGLDESPRYCDPDCPSSYIFCTVGACIPSSAVCETVEYDDCFDGRDEEAALCDISASTSSMSTTSITTGGPPKTYCSSTSVNISSQLVANLPTVLNETVVVLVCVTTGQPLLTATCMLTGLDQPMGGYIVVLTNLSCPDTISASTQRLADLSLEAVTESNIIEIAKEAMNLTNSPAILQPADVSYVSRILQNLAMFFNSGTATVKILMQVSSLTSSILSNIVDVDKEVLRDSRKDDELVTRIVGSFDLMLLKTAEAMGHENQLLATSMVTTKNIAFQVTADPVLAGLALCMLANGSSIPTVVTNDYSCADCYSCNGSRQAEITLSMQARELPRTYVVYSSSSLFGDGAAPGASVLAAQISRASLQPDSSFGSDLVTVRQKINVTAVIKDFYLTCGYWNFSKNDWATTGCSTRMDASSGDVVCTCDHLTNFAVLMVPGIKRNDVHTIVLSDLTIVLLSFSSFALVFVLITFFIFRKLRSSDTQRLTACLSTSLLCMNLLFIFGIEATGDEDVCVALAVMLHYFVLTSFMFMTAEAIRHYLRLVKVLDAHVSHFLWKVSAVSLGVPAVVVIAIRFVDPSLYGKGGQYCWVQPSLQIYGVVVPIAVVVAINSLIFGLIVRALKCRPQQLRSSIPEQKLASLHAKALAAIFVVLGITWVFGLLATIEDSSVVFQYLFCICNSLQGVLIFCFHNMKAPFIARSFRSTLFRSRTATGLSQTDGDQRRISALPLSPNAAKNETVRQPGDGSKPSKTSSSEPSDQPSDSLQRHGEQL